MRPLVRTVHKTRDRSPDPRRQGRVDPNTRTGRRANAVTEAIVAWKQRHGDALRRTWPTFRVGRSTATAESGPVWEIPSRVERLARRDAHGRSSGCRRPILQAHTTVTDEFA